MERFHDVMKQARKQSYFPRMIDFAKLTGASVRAHCYYETGERLPTAAHLEAILTRGGIPDVLAKRLRETHALEIARKLGITYHTLPVGLNLSDLSEKVVREITYELKRSTMGFSPRVQTICKRRVEMLLKNALGIP